LRERALNIPVIVHTADIQETTREKCLELGAIAFLNKPLNSNDLLYTLEQILDAAGEKGEAAGCV